MRASGDRFGADALPVAGRLAKWPRRALPALLAGLGRAARVEPPDSEPLLRPLGIIFLVERGVSDRSWLAPALRRITEVLAPPLRLGESAIDFSRLPRSGGMLLSEPLLQAIASTIDWQSAAVFVHVVVIAEDMRLPPARFNFAVSAGAAATPVHLVIVSLARLGNARDPEMAGARVARMVVKNVARVLGYAGSDRCVFSFPRNLDELDAMPESYCEPDLSVLAAAGIARP